MGRKIRPFEERYWEKVDNSSDGCWMWLSAFVRMRFGGAGTRFETPHRWMLIITGRETVESLRDKKVVRKCGNYRCVNPDHLVVATHSRLGTLHHKTHLTEDDIVSIRSERKDGALLRELASKYRVAVSTVCKIVRHESWTHVE